jgi:hypothetical protein
MSGNASSINDSVIEVPRGTMVNERRGPTSSRFGRRFGRSVLRLFFYIPDALLWICPRSSRFRLAQNLATAAEFLPRRGWYGGDGFVPRWRLDGPRELAFYYVLCRMYRQGRRFDPMLSVIGGDLFDGLAGGALLLTGHFVLNPLFFRWLSDRGRDVVVVTRRTGENGYRRVYRSDQLAEVVPADALAFVQIQRRLAEGKLVCYMADTPGAGRGRRNATTSGVIWSILCV